MNNNAYEFEMLLFKPEKKAKALVHIVHGMAEHVDRYIPFAGFLQERGYAVCMHNHRGHGREAKELGYFGAELSELIEDIMLVKNKALSELDFPKYVLLGHSMGSFFARYLARLECPDALILSGTGSVPRFPALFMGFLARLACRLDRAKKPAVLINALAFSGYTRRIANAKNGFEWLSRDEKEVQKYIDDPLCGFMFSNFSFKVFSELLLKQDGCFDIKNKALPLYIFSGGEDPVGTWGRGTREVFDSYKKAGMNNASLRLYDGARHECLNETNRQEVFLDVLEFLEGL